MSSKSIVLDQDVVVTQLQGKVYLVAADGSQTLLSEGDVLPKDAVLLAPEGASFQGGETTFTLSPSNTPESEDPQLALTTSPPCSRRFWRGQTRPRHLKRRRRAGHPLRAT